MTIAFPTLKPSSRSLELGGYPVLDGRSRDGSYYPHLLGSKSFGAQLSLTFRNVQDSQGASLLNCYRSSRSSFHPLALPPEVVAGIDDEDLAARIYYESAPFPSARYWRIANVVGPTPTEAPWIGLQELAFYLNNTKRTPVSGNTNKIVYYQPLQNLWDNNLSAFTLFSTSDNTLNDLWISYDFGSAQQVNGVKLAGLSSAYYLKRFTLQYSDDNSNWNTFSAAKDLTYPGDSVLSDLLAQRNTISIMWRWQEPPTVDSVAPGICTVQVRLVGTLELQEATAAVPNAFVPGINWTATASLTGGAASVSSSGASSAAWAVTASFAGGVADIGASWIATLTFTGGAADTGEVSLNGATWAATASLSGGAVTAEQITAVSGADWNATAAFSGGAASGVIADTNFSSVQLLLHMDGANNSTTFTDSSASPKTVTAYGDAKVSTTQSKWGGASASFDGSGDYLMIDDGTWAQLNTACTIELWFYMTTYDTTWRDLINKSTYGSNFSWTIQVRKTGFYIYTNNTNSVVTAPLSDVPANTWHHVALTNDPSTGIKLWFNGSLIGSDSGVSLTNASGKVLIGAQNWNAPGSFFQGYIDDVRITKMVRYTNTFTLPTAAFPDGGPVATDAYFSNVSLLLHANGSNGSTTFTDNSSAARTITAYGNAQVSTAQSKFGGAAAALDGSGDYLTAPANAAFAFETGDFTVETWIYISAAPASPGSAIYDSDTLDSGNGVRTNAFVWILDTNRNLTLFSNGSFRGTTVASVPLNQWSHIALVRSGTTWRFYIDGTQDATSFTLSINLSVNYCVIGRVADSASYYLNGYLDDLRITKGVARYTSTFTPPTVEFPDS
jgi:hypothetical protein